MVVVAEMVQSWFSPTGLFLLLNIVIGTIVITSKGFFRSHHHHQQNNFNYKPRSALDRLRSVGSLYRYVSVDQQQQQQAQHPFFDALDSMRHEQPSAFGHHQLHRAPSVLERFTGLYRYCSGEISSTESTHANGSTTTTEATDGSSASDHNSSNKLARSPSVLERLRSVGLSRYRSGEIAKVEEEEPVKQQQAVTVKRGEKQSQKQGSPPQKLESAPSVLERFKSSLLRYTSGEFNLDPPLPPEAFEQDQNVHQIHHKYGRSQSEAKINKEKKKPAAAGKNKVKKSVSAKSSAELQPVVAADDRGVDARADDFINKFRENLRLQRLNSLLQYKDYIN